MKGKLVLDIGCGAGRFTEIALKTGAIVVALDYSSAVDTTYANLKKFPDLLVIQGDIYSLPFAPEKFDYVYCLGVLQHTPNVKKAFDCLPKMLSPNGKICVDYYWKRLRTMMNSKYIVRPITKRMNHELLFKILKIIVPIMLPVSNFFSKIPFLGKALQRTIPISNYQGIHPLTKKQHLEWALLDTFDMLAPMYDNPQSIKTITAWMNNHNFRNIEILHAGHLVARGIKPKV